MKNKYLLHACIHTRQQQQYTLLLGLPVVAESKNQVVSSVFFFLCRRIAMHGGDVRYPWQPDGTCTFMYAQLGMCYTMHVVLHDKMIGRL
jgi:hypothetical protein